MDIKNFLEEYGLDDIHAKDGCGRTALMFAVASDNDDVVNVLLQNGVDINVKDNYGCTVLMYVIQDCYSDLVRFFGYKMNKQEQEKAALAVVARYDNYLEKVKLLVNNGADIHAKDNKGYTALMYAIENDNPDLFPTVTRKTEMIALLSKSS